MHVFLTGANGWIGSVIVDELIEAGHSITALVRSPDSGEKLARLGVEPLVGSLGDLDLIRGGADAADGVIHTAFNTDFAKFAESAKEERAAIEVFAAAYAASDRPIVVTSGLGMLQDGETFAEDARPAIVPDYPREAEQTAFRLAEQGIKASVVRPARSVHGVGERHGFVPQLADIARDKGMSAYVGDGENPWPAVHRLDAARVYRLALERGAGGEAYHAVAEGVPFRLVAEAIGRQLNVPTQSLTPDEAHAHFGDLAVWLTGGGVVSSAWTRAVLDWAPREIGLIADIDRPFYFA